MIVGVRYFVVAVGMLATALSACRSGTEPSGGPRASVERAGTAPTSASARPTTNATPSVALSAEPKRALPALKPIMKKPFPEGTDEATLCEAIDSKEPDLWVRFGHIVPAYITGALYILETGPENKDKLYQYIANDYVYRYHSQQASCRGNLTLLYIRKMFDKSEYRGKPFGREHLSQEMEKTFGIKTRQSFQFQPDEERLSDYCRTDAQLCDRLAKLDFPNNGRGLCSFALSSAGAGADADEERLGQICESLPPFLKVCPYIKWRRDEWPDRQKCDCRLRDALGLPRVPQCER